MESKDELKNLIGILADKEPRSSVDSEKTALKVAQRVRQQSCQRDLLDFGLIKLWSVVLELVSAVYVCTKNKKIESVSTKGDSDET